MQIIHSKYRVIYYYKKNRYTAYFIKRSKSRYFMKSMPKNIVIKFEVWIEI